MPRIIDQHVQLITQSNDCCLLTFPEMRIWFERAWDEMEFTRNPEEFLYLQQNGHSFANRSPWIKFYSHPRNTPLYFQKVRLLHIDSSGRVYDDPRYIFSQKNRALFLRFINLKNRRALDRFIEDAKGFCIFPEKQEQETLTQRYRKAIGEEIHDFLFPMHAPLTEEMTEKETVITNNIREINLDYIWEKKCSLKHLVESYNKGEMKMRELAILSRHMMQISETVLDWKDFNIQKILKDIDAEGDGTAIDTRGFNDVIGEKTVSDIGMLVPAYRAYGHFALCCLEFFLMIKKKQSLDICKACGHFFEKAHGNQKFCGVKCKKRGSNERSRKHRENKGK